MVVSRVILMGEHDVQRECKPLSSN
jgi:hypothetical protein